MAQWQPNDRDAHGDEPVPLDKLSYALLLMLSGVWALMLTAAGLAVTLTIVGAPIGFALIGVGAWPVAKLIQNYVKEYHN